MVHLLGGIHYSIVHTFINYGKLFTYSFEDRFTPNTNSFFPYVVFALISIWRSAEKYEGLKLWRYLAKGIVIIEVFSFLINIGM